LAIETVKEPDPVIPVSRQVEVEIEVKAGSVPARDGHTGEDSESDEQIGKF